MAGKVCGILALALKRSAVESAGGYLRLIYAAVGIYIYRLDAALTREPRAVGLAVIKDIPLSVYLDSASVIVSGGATLISAGL